MTTQQPDALQCAADLEYSIARHGMQDAFTLNAYRAMFQSTPVIADG